MRVARTVRTLLCALSLCALGALAGCSQNAPAAKNDKASKPVPVKTVSVTQQDVERTTTQPATVHAYYRAEIRAKVTGYVKNPDTVGDEDSVGETKGEGTEEKADVDGGTDDGEEAEVKLADIGDVVEAGALLAVIDVPEMEQQERIIDARIARYQAEEKRADAGIELAKANVRSAEAKLKQAESEMAGAQASLTAIQAEFSRTDDLVERGSLEVRVRDEVRKKRDSEIANRDATISAITAAKADVAVAKAKQTSAEADVQAAQAETTIAERQLQEFKVLVTYATLTAPFSGIVTQRSVDPGDLVREDGGEPLFVLSQVSKVRIRVAVPEAESAFVNRGDAMTLTFPSFPAEEAMTVAVTRVSGSLDPSTRTMLVEAEVENPDGKLLPGMFGQASIALSTKVAANMLPARAVRFRESGEAYVYVVSDDATVSEVDVTTGLDDGRSIEVLSGVVAGQNVLDAHLKRFTDGQKVTLLEN